jgi:hypothetical protein
LVQMAQDAPFQELILVSDSRGIFITEQLEDPVFGWVARFFHYCMNIRF